jgi:hypothetical protein
MSAVFQEILPRERDELFLRRVIHDFVPRDARSRCRPVLLGVVAEVRDRGV